MTQFKWTGRTSSSWTDPSNWANGSVPTASDTAYIFGESVNPPIVSTAISIGSITDDEGNLQFIDAPPSEVTGDVVVEDGSNFETSASALTIGGTLSASSGEVIVNGNGDGAASMSAASIDLQGALFVQGYVTASATLSVQGIASFGTAGVLTGAVYVDGNALIKFSGTRQFDKIAAGGLLEETGADAYVADSSLGLTSNSALTGLRTIDGALELNAGAEIDTTGRLTVGSQAEPNAQVTLQGGKLSSQRAFTNYGQVTETGAAVLSASSLVNEKFSFMTIGAKGGDSEGLLDITGPIYNDGTMTFRGDTEEFAGIFEGTGKVSLGIDTTLTFDAAVGRSQHFYLSQSDTLGLSNPGDFHGAVEKFVHDDAFLIHAFDSGTTFNFVEAAGGHGGFLNVADGAHGSAHIYMRGTFDNSDFHLTTVDGGVKIASTR